MVLRRERWSHERGSVWEVCRFGTNASESSNADLQASVGDDAALSTLRGGRVDRAGV